LSYTLTDAAGNESAKSDPIVFSVDATAPDAPIVNPSNGKIVSGKAEPGGTVTVTLPDNTSKEVSVGEDGKWSVTLDTPLTDGQEVKVTASDAAGNTSAPTPVIVDASPPNSPTLVAKEGGVTVTPAVDTDKVVVKYTDDSGAEKEVVANKDTEDNWTLADGTPAGVTIDATTGAISFPAAQIDATQGATAVGSDNAGNNSEPGVLPADATPPNAPVLTEVGSGADVGALKVVFDKAGSDKVVVSYKDDAGADVALVATKDASGNWSLVDAPTGITIDSTAGLISIPANQINPLQGAKAVASDNAGNTSEAKLPTTGTLSLDSFTDTGIGDDHISYDHIFSVKHEGAQADTTVTYQVSTDGGTNWTTVALKDGQPDYSAYQSPVFVYRATDASRFTLDIGSDGTATPNIIVEKGADGVWKLAEGSKILPGGAQINPATGAVSIPQDALPLNADGTPKVTATGASLDPATITAWNQGDYQFRVEVKDAAGNLAYTTIEKAIIEPSTPSPKVYMDVSLEAYIGDLFIEPGKVSDDGKEEVAAGAGMLDGSTMVLSYTLTATNTPTTLTLTKTAGVWTPSSTLPTGFTLDTATGKVAIESGTLVQGSPVTVTENNINGKSSSETNRAPVLANGALNDTWNNTIESNSFGTPRPPVSTTDNDFIFISKSINGSGRLDVGEGNDFVAVGSPATANGGVQNGGRVTMGNGDDTLIVYDRIRTESIIDMGEGNNRLEVGNIHNNSQVRFGSGDDVLSFIAKKDDELRAFFDYGSSNNTNGQEQVNMGNGDNLVKTTDSYGVKFVVGTIKSGSGDDTFDLQNAQWEGGGMYMFTGAGNDSVHLGRMTSGTINLEDGNDIFKISGDTTFDYRFVTGNANDMGQFNGGTVNLGNGDDTIILGDKAKMGGGTMNLDAGNDVVELHAGAVLTGGRINGGLGYDSFKFEGSGQTVNLDRFRDFEEIDLTGTGNNTLTNVSSSLIGAANNGSMLTPDGSATAVNALIIKGDVGDRADLWTTTSSGQVTYEGNTYNVYTSGTNQAWVQDGVEVF
ncbi:MAG: Ig-like domain-containing protein, partial [Pelistega sp.]|nr:Ig-like domain-containing protein [Pelistega sp.]